MDTCEHLLWHDSGFFAVGKTARHHIVGRPTTNCGTPDSAEVSFINSAASPRLIIVAYAGVYGLLNAGATGSGGAVKVSGPLEL